MWNQNRGKSGLQTLGGKCGAFTAFVGVNSQERRERHTSPGALGPRDKWSRALNQGIITETPEQTAGSSSAS